MKTTNLFIDFLVIGFIGVLPLFYCYYVLLGKLEIPCDLFGENLPLTLPIATISIYLLGMLYNQLSSYFVKFLGLVRLLPSTAKLLETSFSKHNLQYHTALQTVIYRSTEAYAYLSYRRSVLRIFRSMILGMSVLITSTVVIFFVSDNISLLATATTILLLFSVLVLSCIVFTKNLKGYYSSIVNFHKVLLDVQ